MNITPTNYNYSNQRAQKNNSQPAFGKVTGKFIREVAPRLKAFIDSAEPKATSEINTKVAQIVNHPLFAGFDYRNDRFCITADQPNGNDYQAVHGVSKDDFADLIGTITNALKRHDNIKAVLAKIEALRVEPTLVKAKADEAQSALSELSTKAASTMLSGQTINNSEELAAQQAQVNATKNAGAKATEDLGRLDRLQGIYERRLQDFFNVYARVY